ncbi:uncharacterized protein LOC115918641 [Strongylocentrotus purpuratus]|uniref:Carboxymuconolactone decarboxylase-like domain-containing protein n=1 Tax=Strongylocentrotus purpuratus TaxID=7668 RepID=A0A7M7NZB3_STRPU|nr:uncharacterized protein LOC115918641 [Strongylocentrotus purpuratus]
MRTVLSPQSQKASSQNSLERCLARFQGTSSKLYESPTPESKPVSRFPIPERETLPEDIQRIMKEVEKQSGFLPNIFKIMSYDPTSFKYFFGYYDHLISDRGNLTKEDKSFISLAVSTENKCIYCTVSHRMVFRLNTNDPVLTDQMTVNWETADVTDRQRAILEMAMAVTKNEPITDEHFTNLERHGLDQRDAFDIGHYAAFFALANRLAIFTKLRPNDEFSE